MKVLFALTILAAAQASAAPMCADLFTSPATRAVDQLVSLRSQIEQARASGQISIARVLYTEFTAKYREAKSLDIDLTNFENHVASSQRANQEQVRTEAERLKQTRHDERHLHNNWVKDHVVKVVASDSTPVFIADRQLLAISERDRLSVYDLETKKEIRSIPLADFKASDLLVSPDRTRVLVKGSAEDYKHDQYRLYALPSFELLHAFEGHGAASFQADGSRLGIFEVDSLNIYDAKTAQKIATYPLHKNGPEAIALTPDGKGAVMFGGFSRAAHYDFATARQDVLYKLNSKAVEMALSEDGQVVAFSTEDNGLLVHHLQNPEPFKELPSPEYGYASLRLSRFGDVVYAASSAKLKVWDARTGAKLAEIKGQNQFGKLSLSPDGNTLAIMDNYRDSSRIRVFKKGAP